MRDASGRIRTHSFTRKEDAQSFELAEKRKRQLVRAGLNAPQDQTLFIDFAQRFIMRRFKSPELAEGTVRGDEGRLRNYWLELLGARALSTITSAEIKARLDEIQFDLGKAPAERNRHRALLHTLFQEAFLEDRVIVNPVSKIPLVTEVRRKKKIVLKDWEPIETYLRALHVEGPHYGMIGEIMAFTGCRICEAVALQWQDVHFVEGVVVIRRIEVRAGGSKIVERTKGTDQFSDDDDAVVVPLFPRLRQALLSHRQKSYYTRPGDFIATKPDGGYIPYDKFKAVHPKAVKAAGLPHITPHTFRASFATLAKKAGYTRAEIREILGHSSEAVTARYDRRDIGHLVARGKAIGFGSSKPISVSLASAEKGASHKIRRKK